MVAPATSDTTPSSVSPPSLSGMYCCVLRSEFSWVKHVLLLLFAQLTICSSISITQYLCTFVALSGANCFLLTTNSNSCHNVNNLPQQGIQMFKIPLDADIFQLVDHFIWRMDGLHQNRSSVISYYSWESS